MIINYLLQDNLPNWKNQDFKFFRYLFVHIHKNYLYLTCNLQPTPASCNLQPATCNLQITPSDYGIDQVSIRCSLRRWLSVDQVLIKITITLPIKMLTESWSRVSINTQSRLPLMHMIQGSYSRSSKLLPKNLMEVTYSTFLYTMIKLLYFTYLSYFLVKGSLSVARKWY